MLLFVYNVYIIYIYYVYTKHPEFLLEMTDAESAGAHLTNPRADLEHRVQ